MPARDDVKREPGKLIGILAVAVGVVWIAGGAAAAFALLGVDGLSRLSPAEAGALAGALILPAMMALFSGAAVR
ncbi:MAG: hypothetical protein JNK94_04180, partial [Hyphomonadaceae bacterium]|nr:hypothetical protein [Hyphomonadaceae bacterium]